MAVKSEQVEKNLVKLTFEVSYDKFEEGMNKAYRKNVKKYNIPGFRKGKVPKAVVEKYYTKAVFYDDAINYVLPDAYSAALEEADIDAVARPEIDVEEIKDNEPVVFTALVTTKPEVKLGKYKGIEIEKIEHTVTDADVDKDIEATQKKNARVLSVEDRPVENGDIVVFDFEGFVDGVAFPGGKAEEYELEIGSGSFIPGFEEQMVGVKIGEDAEVNVTFPEDYHAPELAGKAAVFKIKVHEIKAREYPELNDDFASEVSDFDTMEEYRNDVRTRLEKAAEDRTKAETENAIVDKAAEAAEIDIPDAMIEAQIDRMVNDFAQRLSYQGMNMEMYLQYTGSNMEKFREGFKEQAQKQVRVSLVLEEIAKTEGIEANQEELDQKIADLSKQYNMETEKLQELLRPEDLDGLKQEIALTKTIEMLVNKAKIK
ncbi:MAG TPA: trigger factor [Candidatus Avimonoglobus intestinipullorum]|uniref:Trigger factor n=1 Tax=Candidatus Avimonoglobus intestinipullorum TaxID=2840699 RepID=A0A9D1LTQ7_9FIRM|nr:trigger factor [Candidatus Avimonoglobus intestinipullorum]